MYRAVDHDGDTIDFLLSAKRDRAAARRYPERTIALHGEPEKITIEKKRAGHPDIKRFVRPMPGTQSTHCARIPLAGIETMHMIRKGQLDCPERQAFVRCHPVLLGPFSGACLCGFVHPCALMT